MQSTMSLDPKEHLRLAGVSLSTTLQCPTCSGKFAGMNGVTFPTKYKKGEQWCYGTVIFCSTACVLAWFDPEELAKC